MSEFKNWWVVYRNVLSGEKRAVIICAESEDQARRKARDDAFGTSWMTDSISEVDNLTMEAMDNG